MKLQLALAALLCGTMSSTVATATTPEAKMDFGDTLFKAFTDICLANRGSWTNSAFAAEKSDFKFKKVEIKKSKELEFSNFPLEVVLKRWDKNSYVCLAQSLAEIPHTLETLSERLKANGPDLANVSFVTVKDGLDGTLPKPETKKRRGKQMADLMLRLTPSPLKNANSVQLVVFSSSLEPASGK